jgi:hypothetical protein
MPDQSKRYPIVKPGYFVGKQIAYQPGDGHGLHKDDMKFILLHCMLLTVCFNENNECLAVISGTMFKTSGTQYLNFLHVTKLNGFEVQLSLKNPVHMKK